MWCSIPSPQVSAIVKPSGNGSSEDTPYSPFENIHARPDMFGRTALCSPTCVMPTMRDKNRLPIVESMVTSSPMPTCPLACMTARRAAVPVPHGDRSMRPGGMMVAFLNTRSAWLSVPVNMQNSMALISKRLNVFKITKATTSSTIAILQRRNSDL